jgi:thioredoxin reductase
LVATGLRDELPDILGLRERWGTDVRHCPYCHGWEVRDKVLGVIWNGPDPVRFANIVRQWWPDLVLLDPEDVLAEADRSVLAARSVRVVEGGVERVVVEDDQLSGVLLGDGRTRAR